MNEKSHELIYEVRNLSKTYIMGGLDQPTTGTVKFKEESLYSDLEKDLTEFRRKHIGFVFQFYNLIPSLSAGENVALVTELSEEFAKANHLAVGNKIGVVLQGKKNS